MKERIEWIDILRGIAMFFVVLGHAFVSKTNSIRNYIYSFHMPLFFFISGLTTKRKDISFKEYLKKKSKSILVPYVFINIFVFIIKYILKITLNMYKNLNLKTALIYFLKGYSSNIPCIQSWFLLALFIMDLLFFVITKITKNDKELSIIVIGITILGYLYSISNYNFLMYYHIGTALIGLFYYYLGYMFMKYINNINKVITNNKSLLLLFITIPLGYIFSIMNGRVSMNGNYYHNIFLFIASSLLTIFSLIIIVNILFKKDKLFKEVGILSIFYLGYHGFILTSFKMFVPVLLSNNILTIFTSFITILIIYPIAKIVMKKVPIMVGKI